MKMLLQVNCLLSIKFENFLNNFRSMGSKKWNRYSILNNYIKHQIQVSKFSLPFSRISFQFYFVYGSLFFVFNFLGKEKKFKSNCHFRIFPWFDWCSRKCFRCSFPIFLVVAKNNEQLAVCFFFLEKNWKTFFKKLEKKVILFTPQDTPKYIRD